MAMVIITCPKTGQATFTGIETHPSSLPLIPPINTRLACPHCGDMHIWSILDAGLVAAEPDPAIACLPTEPRESRTAAA